jgi:hypothetical protein
LRAREKYAPDSLNYYPKIEKRLSRWVDIASLELITGDQIAVRRAAEYLENDGYVSAARLMRWRSNLGAIGSIYYKWRNRNYYRRRLDWEKLFAPFLSLQTTSS